MTTMLQMHDVSSVYLETRTGTFVGTSFLILVARKVKQDELQIKNAFGTQKQGKC
jgi:hypothetical protein